MAINLSVKKFLVVDDIPEMRSAIKRLINLLGAKDVDTVKNGREAVNSLARKNYDVVLCDYNLGEGKDGQQVLEEAKHKDLIGLSTIFIMVTAENAMDAVMAVVEHNPDDYLTKPFTKDLLLKRLDRAFAKKTELNEIEVHISKKEYLKALEVCDARIASKPANLGDLLRLKGDILLKAGMYEEAEILYESVLAVRSVPWAELGLGKAKYMGKKVLEAKDVLDDLTRKKRDFVQAYDWLARAQHEVGATQEAQATLETAIELSPKALNRQKELGQIAMKNNDFEAAERAFRKAIVLGKESVFRNVEDYTNLAKVQAGNRAGVEAVKTLQKAKKEFAGDKLAMMQASLAEGEVFRVMERENESNSAYAQAVEAYEGVNSKELPYQISIDVAKANIYLGNEEKGKEIMRDIVLNHSEDVEALVAAQKAFDDAGIGDDGKDLISTVKHELVDLNNQGVNLVKEGKLEDAIRFFLDTLKGMPKNKTVNLNAAQVMLMHMQKNGLNDRYLYKTRECLEKAREIDPTDKFLKKLSELHYKLTNPGG